MLGFFLRLEKREFFASLSCLYSDHVIQARFLMNNSFCWKFERIHFETGVKNVWYKKGNFKYSASLRGFK